MKRSLVRALLLAPVLLLAACEEKTSDAWLGYVEGEDAFIAAPQAGWVSHIGVTRGAAVKDGQVLFTLDSDLQNAAAAQSRAQIAQTEAQESEARANLDYARKELTRQRNLVAARAGTRAALDLAQSNYQSAEARVSQLAAQKASAQAGLSQSSYQLSQRAVTALTHGRVEDIYFRNGEYAGAGATVVSILPPENIYVRFFVPETAFGTVKVGQKVRIACDGCRDVTATITFIAQTQEFTPPVLFSVGSRAKLVYKLEARAPGGLPLNPGQPVDVHPL